MCKLVLCFGSRVAIIWLVLVSLRVWPHPSRRLSGGLMGYLRPNRVRGRRRRSWSWSSLNGARSHWRVHAHLVWGVALMHMGSLHGCLARLVWLCCLSSHFHWWLDSSRSPSFSFLLVLASGYVFATGEWFSWRLRFPTASAASVGWGGLFCGVRVAARASFLTGSALLVDWCPTLLLLSCVCSTPRYELLHGAVHLM